MKTCTRCKKAKPHADFSPLDRTRDGLASHCRECNRALRRASYRKNRGVENAKNAARYRAMLRLSKRHPAEFRRLLAEELDVRLRLVDEAT